MPVNNELKALRYKAGLTQAQAAERIGISTQGYQRYEYGQSLPSPDKIKPLASAFGVSEDAIIKSFNEDDVRVDRTAQMIDVPILSREVVACCGRGQPVLDITSPAEPGIQIPRSRLHRYDDSRPPYAIYADGDCLESEGIEPGDWTVLLMLLACAVGYPAAALPMPVIIWLIAKKHRRTKWEYNVAKWRDYHKS